MKFEVGGLERIYLLVLYFGLEDPELPGANSLLCLIRNCKENGPGGSGAPGSKFLIVFNKEF